MIGVAADPPYKYGQKEVRFMVDNRTKENVLDGALFIDWKNYKGETITQAKKEFWRLFPGGSTETERFSYPEGATYYEVLVEAKKPEPISPSLVVKYNEDPLIKGGLLITYETAIQDKGTPRERWVAKINVKNTAPDKCFGEIALYFRPTDAAGNIVFEKESLGYGGPGLVTKEGFYLWKNPITILYSGKSESFQIFLPYEARKLEFYIQAEELPSQLTIEYISTVREVTLTDYKIQEWSGKVADYIVEKGFATHFNASDEGAHGLFWKVVITITTPVPRSFTSSERHTIHYIATDLTGKILYEGKTVIPPMGVEVSVEKWIWQETWFVSRNVAKLTLIERRLGE